jgi:hypothetical protein
MIAPVRLVLHRRRRLLRDALVPTGDSGLALVTVLAAGFVLTLLVVTTISVTTATQSSSRRDQDWNAALAAAQAGVDDYIARIDADGTYWQYGNPASAFSAGSSVTLPTGSNANAAFTGWRNAPGSSARAQYRYDVNTSAFSATGVVRLQSTGRSGDRTRTVEVTVGRRSFLDFLYFTDIETKDPATYSTSAGDSYDVAGAYANCDKRVLDGRRDRGTFDSGRNSNPGCTPLNFSSLDLFQGPVHSNDALLICGLPTFTSRVSTSYDGSFTSGRNYVRNTGACASSTPQIAASANNPQYAAPLALPPSNTALSSEVDPASTGGDPGCLYTGPTSITVRSDGRMNVTSPWSANGGAMWCGTGNGLALPARGVIWVRAVPAAADAYTASVTCPSTGNNLGYPVTVTSGSVTRTDVTSYGCRDGDVFVSGQLSGQLTIGAANNIVIVDDLTYATSSCSTTAGCSDVLGLIANNFVEVYNPYGCSGSSCANLTTATRDLTIEAALLAVQHTIRVQNFQLGTSRGTLTIRGSLGQKYRGPVGTFSGSTAVSGYAKNYIYDSRLAFVSPPHFIDPVQSGFSVKSWSEKPAAYGP